MKSTIECYGVTVDNFIETLPKHSIHAGCYGVSIIESICSMCAGACMCVCECRNTVTP